MRAFVNRTLGDVGSERLQAALRVAVVAEQHGVGEPVDQPAAHLAQPPGPHERRRLGVAPAADHHVPAVLDAREERHELRGRVGEVGVGEGDRPTVRREDPGAHRGPLPPVGRVHQHLVGARGPRRLGGAVARAVVDHHDLELVRRTSASPSSARRRPTVVATLVGLAVGGHDHRQPEAPGRGLARDPRLDVGPHLLEQHRAVHPDPERRPPPRARAAWPAPAGAGRPARSAAW